MRLAEQPAELVSTDDVVRRAVFLARGCPTQSVSVAGPDSLEAMIVLCRAGFESVTCARQTTGVAEASDLLLIIGLMTRSGLADVLSRTCRLLHSGGALVVQLAHPADDAVVRAVLAGQGLGIAASRFDIAVGWLVTHTVER